MNNIETQPDLTPTLAAILEPSTRLDKDLILAARNLGKSEIRFLVARYYDEQDRRKAASSRAGFAEKAAEPNDLLR